MRAWLGGALLVALCASVLGACAAPRVVFAPTPQPVLPAARYDEVRDRWLRHLTIHHDFSVALDADVVLLSPEYRAAWVGKVSALRRLPESARADLAAAQGRDAESGVEVVVVMQSNSWSWNDLGARHSIWTLTYSDGEDGQAGHEALPLQVRPLELKPAELAALFPNVTPFSRAWLVRFPSAFADGTPLFRPDLRQAAVRIAGPLGQAEARWRAR